MAAVASDEGFWEGKLLEDLEAIGSLREEVDETLIQFMIQVFSACRFHFLWKTCQNDFHEHGPKKQVTKSIYLCFDRRHGFNRIPTAHFLNASIF